MEEEGREGGRGGEGELRRVKERGRGEKEKGRPTDILRCRSV